MGSKRYLTLSCLMIHHDLEEMNPWALPQQGEWRCSLGLPWRPLMGLHLVCLQGSWG